MRRISPLLLLTACAPTWQDMEPDQVCSDVGFAISARTMECTGDPDLAAARDAALNRDYRCQVRSVEDVPIDRYYHCPIAVYDLGCKAVERNGDDLDLWLEASWVCDVILTPKGAE